jgi:hypothetical protein
MASTKAAAAAASAGPDPAQEPPPEQAPPDSPVPAPEEPAEAPAGRPAEGCVFEYIDPLPTTYRPQGHPPQTAGLGDVCELPFTPTDGKWKPSTAAVTRLPDNHPDNSPGEPDWENVARSVGEQYEIFKRLGLLPEGDDDQ